MKYLFTVGQEIGGRVVEWIDDSTGLLQHRKYGIRYVECGHTAVVTHFALAETMRKNVAVAICPVCTAEKREAKERRRQARREAEAAKAEQAPVINEHEWAHKIWNTTLRVR